ncbi:MAG: M20/M25/M40 family metallo-hydrolase [Planctomycetes bacterium]|nr:M20/M25/M40 family metallo-hydrolase [Planctomycetota bacterium]
MRRLLSFLLFAVLLSPLAAQDSTDRAAEILKKIDAALKQESERSRAELLDLVRQELRGTKTEPAPAAARTPAPSSEKAKAVVTTDLLKKHASYLASDELEGRCAGYPGCDKAADYIAGVFKKSGLKPAGDAGGYFQKFRLAGKDTKNVIGLIEGSDPQLKSEYVVVGAHYDHVGTADQRDFGRMGGKGDDTIWNGADDNGSGTTCVLALAQAFGEGGLSSRRTLVFMCFSGEEAGLVGSRWYTNHPLGGSIDQHAFMLNLDMVGRNPTKPIEIHGVGSGDAGVIRKAVERAVAASGLKAKLNDTVTLMGGDSDHSSFADKRVPYAFFFSGFHADYHRPSDHAEKLAYDNMVKVANTSMDILLEMGGLDEKPKFAGKSRPGFNLPDLEPPVQTRVMGVTVQELDDADCNGLKLAAQQGGLRVDAVKTGSAAEAAGVKVGDVVLSLAGTTLPRGGTRDELRRVLTEKVKPGKETEIVVLRQGERVALKAKWTE